MTDYQNYVFEVNHLQNVFLSSFVGKNHIFECKKGLGSTI